MDPLGYAMCFNVATRKVLVEICGVDCEFCCLVLV